MEIIKLPDVILGIILIIVGNKNLQKSKEVAKTGKPNLSMNDKIVLLLYRRNEEKTNELKESMASPERILRNLYGLKYSGYGLIFLGVTLILSAFL